MAGRVEGKVAVLIGGGQTAGETVGNGRATALVLAREGARVFVVDRDLESADETAKMIKEQGGVASSCQADVTSEEQVKIAIKSCVELCSWFEPACRNFHCSGWASLCGGCGS